GDRVARVRPYATLRYDTRGAVATVTLDRPEVLNAYNMAMRDDLHAVLAAADADPAIRVLVLRGRGPAFSTGGDLREFGSAPSPFIARQVRWQRDVWGQLLRLRAITLAAVHSLAVGGGMEMALLCDLCIAAADASFALPETGRGMIPGVAGTQTLPRRVGVGRALGPVLARRRVDAGAAGRLRPGAPGGPPPPLARRAARGAAAGAAPAARRRRRAPPRARRARPAARGRHRP